MVDYDILEDRVAIEGEIVQKDLIESSEKVCRFRLVAHNCLLKKKDEIYQHEILTQKVRGPKRPA